MSRSLNRRIEVQCDTAGVPVVISIGRVSLSIRSIVDDWREWFGAIFGEPERDIWIVETAKGIYELHCVRFPREDVPAQEHGQWTMERVED